MNPEENVTAAPQGVATEQIVVTEEILADNPVLADAGVQVGDVGIATDDVPAEADASTSGLANVTSAADETTCEACQ